MNLLTSCEEITKAIDIDAIEDLTRRDLARCWLNKGGGI